MNSSDSPAALDLYAIVLAAGASRRFGSPKQLARVDGRTLLQTAVERAVALCGHAVIVVLGARAAELAPLLRRSPALLVVNRGWEEGLGSSIRAGIAHLPGSCDGVLLMLADQPAVTSADLRRLADGWRRQPECIAAALYDATVGVPAIFPRSCLRELGELRGDSGARALIARNPDRVVRVAIPRAALDIDTPEDLRSLEAAKR